MRTFSIFILTVIFLAAFACMAEAQIPNVFSFQGVLADAAGAQVADGSYRLTFKLYDSPTAPTARWSESQDVAVSNGIFNVQIGAVSALTLPFDMGYFLGIAIDGGTELLPRTALTSIPYAFVAKRALTAAGLEPGASGVVTSVNTLSGAITLEGGGSTTISRSGNKILISSTGGSGGTGIQGVQNTDGTISVLNPTGPVATIGLEDAGIGTAKLQDGSVTGSKLVDGSVTGEKIAAGQVVKRVTVGSASIQDEVVLEAGTHVTLNTSGNKIIISSTGGTGGTGVQEIQNADATLNILNGTGPIATINVAGNAIGTTHLADAAVTAAKVSGAGATGGQVLTYDGSNVSWATPSSSGVTGSGAGDQLTLWNGTSTLSGNSNLVYTNGNLGIGVSSPAATLQVSGNDGVLAQGAFGSGTATNLGAGTRMHWYPKKAAFRAGSVSGSEWDDANIGNCSVAMGQWTTASGSSSVAMGHGSTASNSISFAMGAWATASGSPSFAIGNVSKASGSSSISIGYSTTASGDYSTAMGSYVSTNNRTGTFMIGDHSVVTPRSAYSGNCFYARFDNGYMLWTSSDYSTGARMDNGANSWSSISDSTKKEGFQHTDGEALLHRFADLRLGSWNYRSQSPVLFRHYGPMAQEWFAAFGNDGIGKIGNDTTIASADMDGILCIAVQALERRTAELGKTTAEFGKTTAELEKNTAELGRITAELQAKSIELNDVKGELAAYRAGMKVLLARVANLENSHGKSAETAFAVSANSR